MSLARRRDKQPPGSTQTRRPPSYSFALRQPSQVIVAVSVFFELVSPITNVPTGVQIYSFCPEVFGEPRSLPS
jgi:hypothetical protein